jgi:hypothetical protein
MNDNLNEIINENINENEIIPKMKRTNNAKVYN